MKIDSFKAKLFFQNRAMFFGQVSSAILIFIVLLVLLFALLFTGAFFYCLSVAGAYKIILSSNIYLGIIRVLLFIGAGFLTHLCFTVQKQQRQQLELAEDKNDI